MRRTCFALLIVLVAVGVGAQTGHDLIDATTPAAAADSMEARAGDGWAPRDFWLREIAGSFHIIIQLYRSYDAIPEEWDIVSASSRGAAADSLNARATAGWGLLQSDLAEIGGALRFVSIVYRNAP